MRFRSPSPEASRAAARALADCLVAPLPLLALSGPLGAGKTLFVKGLAEGLGLDPAAVASPTFVLMAEYELPLKTREGGPPPQRLAHVDAYRLESAVELEAAGFLDLLEPDTLVALEWADRFPEALVPERLELAIERPGGAAATAGRVLHAKASGARAAALLAAWRERLAALPEIELE